ncbi:MAG: tRNA (adenosine(37)-N6)-threonylcarbamoyltransferase complex ATPase subunit type 1 TsaE [Gemmatimonadaceae bacterium]
MGGHPIIPSLAAGGTLSLTESELVTWGERLGHAITPPLVITIEGDLGAGKTTLTRAICRGYGVSADVTSPTFTIVHEYEGSRSRVYHLDLYRLRQPRELEAIGWDDMLQEGALVVVEWPDRAPALMPHGHVPISLSHVTERPDHRVLYAGGHT